MQLLLNISRCSLRVPFKRLVSDFSGNLSISTEVSSAIKSGNPVVALESTIITHGMPYPENFSTACKVEEIIRNQGCVPATVAIVDGTICVGISKTVMDNLASKRYPAIKTSRRDLPFVLSKGLCGGTTVSATMIAAKMAGINVFVTGGIGGVHRGVNDTMDVSADLNELGRTPLAVVSSGVKSILDVAKTLEYLETQGVCVATFGENREFPSFFSPRAVDDDGRPLLAPYNVSTAKEAAMLIYKSLSIDLSNGILIAVPPPPNGMVNEEENDIEKVIQETLSEARSLGIQGKDVTPFILKEVASKTNGRSLSANVALIQHNAAVGANIAKELQEIINNKSKSEQHVYPLFMKSKHQEFHQVEEHGNRKPCVVVGGSVLDSTLTIQEDFIKMDGRTHAATVFQSSGGVGRNLADALGRLLPQRHPPPLFISAVGKDAAGEAVLADLKHLNTSGVLVSTCEPTASYTAVLDRSGECVMGIGNMAAHNLITVDHVKKFQDNIKNCPMLMIDGNVSQDVMDYVLEICSENGVPVWFEPTDVKKAMKAFNKKYTIDFTSPNLNELRAIVGGLVGCTKEATPQSPESILKEAMELSHIVLNRVQAVFVTLGKLGVLVSRRGLPDEPLLMNKKEMNDLSLRLYQAPVISTFKSVSGAGDCFAAGMVSGMLRGLSESKCVGAAIAAAAFSISAPSTVPSEMKSTDIHWGVEAKYKSYP